LLLLLSREPFKFARCFTGIYPLGGKRPKRTGQVQLFRLQSCTKAFTAYALRLIPYTLRLAPFICHEEGNTARRVSLLFRLTICMNLPNLFDIFCLLSHLLHAFLCLFNKLMPF
jgi:hypothetical protein